MLYGAADGAARPWHTTGSLLWHARQTVQRRRFLFYREEMDQPVFEAIDELEYPELYDEAIPILTFFKYLRKLMGAAGYHDFSMRVS